MLKFNSLLLALPLLTACPPAGDTAATDTGVCSSGTEWTGGDEESPNMNPGQDCIACHASGEGPTFTIAGTVMGDFADPDDCNGVEGMIVRITDADGVLIELTSNAAGNFYSTKAVAMPYTAEVEGADGVIGTMSGEQTSGACGSCHTAEGAEGAPGRVVEP